MAIPLSYSARNLFTRRMTTLLTAGGMSLVVFTLAASLMLAEGLRRTLVQTGAPDNIVAVRKGADAEGRSNVDRDQTVIMENSPQISLDGDGKSLAAGELVVSMGLPKRGSGAAANATFRGIAPASLVLRPQVRIIAGRAPRPGTSEIMAGKSVVSEFAGVDLGGTLRFAKREWTVTGVFDAGDTAYSSEIWGNREQLMSAFGRGGYNIFVARLRDPGEFEALKTSLENDPRLNVDVWREPAFYERQSRMMSEFFTVLGLSMTLVFSLAAVIGAMITMYSAVAGRVAEIGTLRALGFTRLGILTAFLAEAAFLGVLSGVMGLTLASGLCAVAFSTANMQTFSQLAFGFVITPKIVLFCMLFALGMGVIGGLLPAIRAARMNIVEALRGA